MWGCGNGNLKGGNSAFLFMGCAMEGFGGTEELTQSSRSLLLTGGFKNCLTHLLSLIRVGSLVGHILSVTGDKSEQRLRAP